MRSIRILLIGLALAAGAPLAVAQTPPPPKDSAPAYDSLGADWGAQQDEARAGVRQGRYVPLAQVIAADPPPHARPPARRRSGTGGRPAGLPGPLGGGQRPADRLHCRRQNRRHPQRRREMN